jgi:membrane-associated phospholipid phosphatase
VITLCAAAARSFSAYWRLKLALSVVLTLSFCIPYFTLQHIVLFPVRRLPPTILDRAIELAPVWVWVYQSVYLLLSVVPWLSKTAGELIRYARGFILQASIGFAFFLILPVQGPRPPVLTSDPMFQLLVWYDAPLNCFPSLHIGLSVYTVLFATRISRGRLAKTPRIILITAAAIWTLAIAFSALATKQHYAVDLPAGAVLALLCHTWTWRRGGMGNGKWAVGNGRWGDGNGQTGK